MKLTLLTILLIFSGYSFTQEEVVQIELQTGHTEYITASAFSNDGKLIATGGADNSILLWDVNSGKQIRTILHHSDEINTLQFSPEDSLLISTSKDNTITISEILTGKLIHKFTFKNHEISNAYFSKDGSKIIAITNRDSYFIYNTYTTNLLFEGKKDYSDYKSSDLISPNGDKALIKIGWQKIACIYIESKDTLFTIPIEKALQMKFSPSGKYIVASSAKLFSKVFDAETGKEISTLEANPENKCDGCNTKVCISPNDKYVFSKSSKNDGTLWDLTSGKKIATYNLSDDRPYELKFSSNSNAIILSMDDEMFCLSTDGKVNWKVKSKWIEYYSFNINNNKILLPDQNNTGIIYSINSKVKQKVLKGLFNEPNYSGLDLEQTNYYDKAIINFLYYKSNVSITPENSGFLIGKTDTSARIIDIQTGKTTTNFSSSKTIFTHAYSKDGNLLALAGGNNSIDLYNTNNNTKVAELKGHQGLIFDITFNDDNTRLLSGSWDGTMIVWNLKSFKAEKRIDLNNISAYSVKFDPNGIYAISGDLSENITYWEIDSKKEFRNLIGHTNTISDIEFKPDGNNIVSVSWDNKIKIWDAKSGIQLRKIHLKGTPIYSVCADEKTFLTGDANQNINIWDWNGNFLQQLTGHSSPVTDIQISNNKQFLISRAANGEVIVWDYLTKKMKYKYFQFTNNEWVALNENGYFDGSAKAIKMINYVVGNKVIAVNSLFDKYYTPSLISRIMNDEGFETTGKEINKMIENKPEIEVQIANTQSRNTTPIIDNIYESNKETLELIINSKQKDIEEVRVYNNGKLQTNNILKKEINFRGNNDNFTVQLADGLNNINVIAIKKGVESEPINIKINYSSKLTHSNLYLLTVGVNKYKNTSYNLNYAEKDADEFAKTIIKGADTLFDQIKKIELNNEEATKENIKQAIAQITEEITPNDVFVFYFAGHGIMSLAPDEKFYLATHDLTNFYDSGQLEKEGLSADELIDFSKNISAQKQLFILDACHSGGALNALSVRGANREKAIAQLARTTGTYFLTAAEDAQYANESGNLKHGLFTYAILEILQGKNQLANIDGVISVNEIKSYIENRVPELSEEVHGTPQFPTSYSFGQDFPIVILK